MPVLQHNSCSKWKLQWKTYSYCMFTPAKFFLNMQGCAVFLHSAAEVNCQFPGVIFPGNACPWSTKGSCACWVAGPDSCACTFPQGYRSVQKATADMYQKLQSSSFGSWKPTTRLFVNGKHIDESQWDPFHFHDILGAPPSLPSQAVALQVCVWLCGGVGGHSLTCI